MAVAGLRGTGSWGADERPKNFRELILWRNPNGTAPIFALTSKLESEKVNDPEFSWWEEEAPMIRLQIAYATGFSTTDTSLTVSVAGSVNAQDLVPGDMLLVESALTTAYAHELLLVSSITSSSVVVVVRGAANTTATPILQGTFLTKLGSAYAEGSGAPNAASRNPTKYTNLIQTFKTAFEVTRDAQLTYARTGNPLKNDKKRKTFDHSRDIEMQILFGKKYETTGSNGQPERYMGGILYQMSQGNSSSIKAYTTTPTISAFLDDISPIWDYDTGAGNERVVFAGNGALNSLNKLALNQTNTRVMFQKTVNLYGMELDEWRFPQGKLYFKTHPLLNVHGRFTNDMIIFDPTCARYRYLEDTYEDMGPGGKGIQLPGEDKTKGQWVTKCSLEFRHLKTSKWVHNFVVP